jgi:glycosyltransferase involved in cell wall biosynthesis
MHVLFLTENFPPETNAAATRVYERACYWIRWGHKVTVVTCAPNFPDGKLFAGYRNFWRQVEEMDGIRVVRMKSYITPNRGVVRRALDFASFMFTGWWAALTETRPDVICANSPQFLTAVAGWGAAAMRRVPFVFELADLWPASISAVGAVKPGMMLRLVEKLELFLYRRAAAVVALTEAFKINLVSRGIAADKIAVVVNGVDLRRYAPAPRDQVLAGKWGLTGKFTVGYVGTHGMAHGLSNVLDTAEHLADQSDICFVLVGAGAEREALIAEAKQRGLTNVIFAPMQPKASMPKVWGVIDVALVHLRNDPVFAGVIPSKIFEAMAMGRPVLLSAPAGEASRIVEQTGAGIAVPPMDPAALAAAVRTLHDDDRRRFDHAKASRNASALYSRDEQARKVIEVFECAIEGRQVAADQAVAR